jgi:hypothetical protein
MAGSIVGGELFHCSWCNLLVCPLIFWDRLLSIQQYWLVCFYYEILLDTRNTCSDGWWCTDYYCDRMGAEGLGGLYAMWDLPYGTLLHRTKAQFSSYHTDVVTCINTPIYTCLYTVECTVDYPEFWLCSNEIFTVNHHLISHWFTVKSRCSTASIQDNLLLQWGENLSGSSCNSQCRSGWTPFCTGKPWWFCLGHGLTLLWGSLGPNNQYNFYWT